jgi:type III secretory pathway component EscS
LPLFFGQLVAIEGAKTSILQAISNLQENQNPFLAEFLVLGETAMPVKSGTLWGSMSLFKNG